MTNQTLDLIVKNVLHVARSNKYHEDQPGFVWTMGGRKGDDWCAIYAGYCWRRGYRLSNYELEPCLNIPSVEQWTFKPGSSLMVQKGARALVRQMGAVGRIYTNPAEVRPGDLGFNKRGILPWQGHVWICTGSASKTHTGVMSMNAAMRGSLPTWKIPYIAGNESNMVKEGYKYSHKLNGLMFASLYKDPP